MSEREQYKKKKEGKRVHMWKREREGIWYIERGSASALSEQAERRRGRQRKFIRHSLGGNA